MRLRTWFWRPVVVIVATNAACGGTAAKCDLQSTATELGGPTATDCGFVPAGNPGTEQWDCAVAALSAQQPFVITFEQVGIDSTLTGAFVSTDGTMWRLQQDSFGRGPGEIDGWECLEPAEAPDDTGDSSSVGVVCASLEPEGNHYQVCGAICGPEQCQPQPLPFQP